MSTGILDGGRHGTRSMIARGCACDGCRLMARLYERQGVPMSRSAIASGKRVSAIRARYLIRKLSEAGYTYKQIGAMAGISHTAVRLIAIKATQTIYPFTHDGILQAAREAGMHT